MSNDSVKKIVVVATSLCVVCSIVVSSAAVFLRELQDENVADARKKNILVAAGLMETDEKADLDALYEQIEPVVVRMEDGEVLDREEWAEGFVPDEYEQAAAVAVPENTVAIPQDVDGGIVRTKPKVAVVYKHVVDGELKGLVLPIKGMGLWGMMYGFVALEPDLRTVKGIVYYEHKETPGLGAEVDNPRWRAQWGGKKALDSRGDVLLDVVKPGAAGDSDTKVDGLSGATITANGVEAMMQFWLSEEGYGPYLDHLRKQLEKGAE